MLSRLFRREKLDQGVEKSRAGFFGRIRQLLTAERPIDDDLWDELEELLLELLELLLLELLLLDEKMAAPVLFTAIDVAMPIPLSGFCNSSATRCVLPAVST